MRVSVVIRSKNEEKTLPLLLEKLKSQTIKDFETILVDNSSSDKTIKIAKEFGIEKIINIPEEKFTHPSSINKGIKEAEGEVIVVTNAHCVPLSNSWLSDGLKNFKDKKVAGISGYYRSDEGQIKLFWIRKKSNHMTTTNAIIRKDLWKLYNFDESLVQCEDYDWSLEMISRGYKIIKDPKFSVRHMHNIDKVTKDKWQSINKIIENRKRPTI